ncbi:uncharacterized protein LOC132561428 [Ylistrum balloti]|uniref:uncharacterized protein LOC132561428 n=1 Tax=Ylistrum balloti TaxID=509963 RepID=UPI002905CA5B|nr:uncharacterized protein LOC132561428 [Ylistrum balloti]
MSDQGDHYYTSWILHRVLDKLIGSADLVALKRKLKVLTEHFDNVNMDTVNQFYTGSSAEGVEMPGSDVDVMLTLKDIIVLCQEADTCYLPDNISKTVLVMRDADSRPGYMNLELAKLRQRVSRNLFEAIVQIGDIHFISSEIFNRSYRDKLRTFFQLKMENHGPAASLADNESNARADIDVVCSFSCSSWPKEADEWVTRPRFHNWPSQSLRDQIVQDGCHIVPVGDKTSAGTFLQWRISFVTAERKLIHSLTHTQFLVYGLLKYFLKQMSEMLKQLLGETEILSSYIIKTIVFHAVESTPNSMWQEKHTFACFMFCINMLISWVRAGYCPNYFINRNNMFLGKVYGENQQNLLRFLIDLHDMKWGCLSVGEFITPSVGEHIDRVRSGEWDIMSPHPELLEQMFDLEIFKGIFSFGYSSAVLRVSLKLLSESMTDIDEFLNYAISAQAFSYSGMELFGEHTAAEGNKEKYKSLRKSKNLLKPLASICASPGLLTLATYHYQTGNYVKALDICGEVISTFKLYVGSDAKIRDIDMYQQLFCGQGYTLLQKSREGCVSNVIFLPNAPQFYPSHLHQEMTKNTKMLYLSVPPLPYAVFLSFLCYHEQDDPGRRDAALINLRAVKYDEEQGVGYHWIVHNLLGICYEMIGDRSRALREYNDSLHVRSLTTYKNPAKERIDKIGLL